MKPNVSKMKKFLNEKDNYITHLKITRDITSKNVIVDGIHIIKDEFVMETISFTVIDGEVFSFNGKATIYLIKNINEYYKMKEEE